MGEITDYLTIFIIYVLFTDDHPIHCDFEHQKKGNSLHTHMAERQLPEFCQIGLIRRSNLLF